MQGCGAIVADIGSFAFRLGCAGDDLPRCYRPSVLGLMRGSHYYELSQPREDLSVISCVDSSSGLLNEWDLLEKMFSFAQQHYLKLDYSETPLVLAEKPYNTPKLRHRTCEILFEKHRLPALFMAKDAVLSCYACGKTSGLVIDVGASGTSVTPVQDGWVEARHSIRSIVGGRYMDNYMLNLVKRRKGTAPTPFFRLSRTVDAAGSLIIQQRNLSNIHPSYEALMNLELARDLKETVCRTADNALLDAEQKFSSIPTSPYELPDGTIIDMGIERYQVPELLCASPFPDFSLAFDDLDALGINKECSSSPQFSAESIPRIALDCTLRCETELQGNLFSNIVVTGGGSCFDGLPERLKYEIEKLVNPLAPQTKVKVMAAGTGERGICAWLGGSILGSLGSFNEMWFTKAEYDEYGAQLIDRKCP